MEVPEVLAEGGEDGGEGGGGMGGEVVFDRGGEIAGRAEIKVMVRAGGFEMADGGGEIDAAAEGLPEVGGRGSLVLMSVGGGHDGEARSGVGDAMEEGVQRGGNKVRPVGVEGMGDGEVKDLGPTMAEEVTEAVERGGGTGDEEAVGKVPAGNLALLEGGRELAEEVRGIEDGEHPAWGGAVLEEGGFLDDEDQGVFEGEDVGDDEAGDFAEALSEEGSGWETAGQEDAGEGAFDREDGGAGMEESPEGLEAVAAGAIENIEEGLVDEVAEDGVGFEEVLSEERFLFEEFASHPVVLGALAGEHPDGAGWGRVFLGMAVGHASGKGGARVKLERHRVR